MDPPFYPRNTSQLEMIIVLVHPLLTNDEIKKALPLFQRERIPDEGNTKAA